MLSLKQIYCNRDILNTLFNDKDKYNNSVHFIRNKNHQEKIKEDEMQIYFEFFDGPIPIQKYTTFEFEGDHQKG